jgi:signal transduction histidine kinase
VTERHAGNHQPGQSTPQSDPQCRQGYASAAGTGIGLAIAGQPLPLMAGALIWSLAVLCALPATRLRYLRAAGHDKERMQWLGTGLTVAASVALIGAVLHLLVGWPASPGVVAAAASAAVPLGLIAAEWQPLARHSGQVLAHTLSAAGSGAVIAVIYLVIVAGLGKTPDNSAERELLGFSMLAAVVAAIGYLPVRARLVASATRFVYGTREAPGEALRTFGSAWASVWLPALLDGREQAQLRVAPISHAGELLGLIVVERATGADTFTEEDDPVLTELARQAGLAFHNSQLDSALQTTLDALRKQADELRESRARVVASGDAERRRVERNLHDGAQQHLVALAINLRLARDIVTEDPDGADEMLGQLADDVQLTIKELRELAHGIYPPLLADNGLGDAAAAEPAATRTGARTQPGPRISQSASTPGCGSLYDAAPIGIHREAMTRGQVRATIAWHTTLT